MRPKVFCAEVVETVEGLWCPTCARPAGVKITVCLNGWRVGTILRCRDCGSTDIDPSD